MKNEGFDCLAELFSFFPSFGLFMSFYVQSCIGKRLPKNFSFILCRVSSKKRPRPAGQHVHSSSGSRGLWGPGRPLAPKIFFNHAVFRQF